MAEETAKKNNARGRYLSLYAEAMASWPVTFEELDLRTRFGGTHVIAYGDRSRPPLVLVHGISISSTMWGCCTAALSREYRIYAVDIIGDVNRSVAVRPPVNGREYAEWLNEVVGLLGLGAFDLVGFSLGGWVSANLAVHYPRAIKKLVLVSPVGVFAFLSAGLMLQGMKMTFNPSRGGIRKFVGWLYRPAGPSAVIEQFVAALEVSRMSVKAIPFQLPGSRVARFSMPVRLILGSRENLFNPFRALRKAARLLPGIEAEILPDTGHIVPMERPAEFEQRVMRFLRGG